MGYFAYFCAYTYKIYFSLYILLNKEIDINSIYKVIDVNVYLDVM